MVMCDTLPIKADVPVTASPLVYVWLWWTDGERRDEWTSGAVEKVALLSKLCLMQLPLQEPAGSTVWASVYNVESCSGFNCM